MTLVEIQPREAPRGEPVEYEVTISEEGVPVFISWQPFESPELAQEAVIRLFSDGAPATLKVTDWAGRETVEEIR